MKTFSIIPQLALAVCMLAFMASCSKENGAGPDSGLPGKMTGSILHQYTSEVQKIDASTGRESVFFSYNSYSTVGWSVSRDGTLRLMAEREPGVYDRTRIILVNTADETIVKDFDYVPQFGNNINNMGALSFDNSMILVKADNENGFVILNTDGEVLHRLDGINNRFFSGEDQAVWLPDNSIVICFDEFILRTEPPYTSLSLIREMNYENWGNLRVSMDGSKLSMYINRHVYLMDSDGNNLVQVTDGDNEEIFGEFSPDGRHLLIGSDYFHAPASSNSHWYLKIIPADGKKYNMDSDPAVVPVIPAGSSGIVRANGVTCWRP